jgi:hypothetical protein
MRLRTVLANSGAPFFFGVARAEPSSRDERRTAMDDGRADRHTSSTVVSGGRDSDRPNLPKTTEA